MPAATTLGNERIPARRVGAEAMMDVLGRSQYMRLKESITRLLMSSNGQGFEIIGMTATARRCAHAAAGRLQWKHESSDVPGEGRVITLSPPEPAGGTITWPAASSSRRRELEPILLVDSSSDSSESCVFRADIEEAKLRQAKRARLGS